MFMFSAGVLLNISKQETRIREAESGG